MEGAAALAGQQIGVGFMRAFYDRVTPALDGDFDSPAMLPLIAPRPFLIISGDSDPPSQAGVREAAPAAETSYRANGAADRFKHLVLPTPAARRPRPATRRPARGSCAG